VARETGCDVIGVELSPASVEIARQSAQRAGLSERARFVEGDAESLAFGDAIADGVICECALCTFPDKPRAVAEIARVLKPGGMLALSDMVAERERLPDELRTLEAWVSCFADARPLAEIERLLAEEGLAPVVAQRHDDALATMLARVDAPPTLLENVERGLSLVANARRALADGALGYGVVIARRT